MDGSDAFLRCSAERPEEKSNWYRLAFYNLGWKASSKNHTMERLAREMCELIELKDLDALGLCHGLFAIRQELSIQRRDVLLYILRVLNCNVETTGIVGLAPWRGRCDGHYIFLWNAKRLSLTKYEYVNCGIEDQPWRMAQYLQFHRSKLSGPPLHVCHNDSLCSKYADLTLPTKQKIFANLWEHVLRNGSSDSFDSVEQPVTIFGGDFNCNVTAWEECLHYASDTMASRRTSEICESSSIWRRHEGDRALVFNAVASQEDSDWGKSFPRRNREAPFSDDHDVVLVPLWWQYDGCETINSAAQPVASSMPTTSKKPYWSQKRTGTKRKQYHGCETINSAEQPVASTMKTTSEKPYWSQKRTGTKKKYWRW